MRGLAVLVMVLGHVSDSWTRETDRHALPYWTISFIAGLGAPLFLFIAGVAMALAAHSRAATRGVSEAARGLWIRGWQIFALAFLFRLQALVLGQGAPVTLLTVDILNVMGLSMVAGALVWRAGSPGKSRLLILAAAVILIAAATPWLWTTSWLAWMPDPVRWYLQPTPGRTNFTLVPSAGFLMAGLLAGELLARAHATTKEHRTYIALALAGALIAGVGWWASHGPPVFAGATFWGSSPTFFAVRLGLLVLLLPAAWAYYRVWRVWRAEGRAQEAGGGIVETLGRSSLFVYWIHVEMVYGHVATPLKRQLSLETMLMAAGALSLLLYGIVLVKNRWTRRGQGERRRSVKVTALVVACVVLAGTVEAQEARRRWEMERQIRLDKFEQILPKAMREHGIDMWIVAVKENHYDPLWRDLGRGYVTGIGYYMFTDRGGDRIERLALGPSGYLLAESGAYDAMAPASRLAEYVRERDPQRIGVNMSDELGPADGLTYTMHRHLQKTLGEPYASRLVSAERLVSDFRSRRVAAEIVAFGEAASIAIQLAERALSNEVITVGRSTLEDVAWWMQDRLLERGLGSEFDMPSVYVTGPEGIVATSSSRIVQPGDVMMIDWGVQLMNFGTDIKRVAYVLRPGELVPPRSIQEAFDKAVAVRAALKPALVAGRTAKETMTAMDEALRKAGYGVIEFNRPNADDKTDVAYGFHPVGNTGHGMGASMTTWQPFQSTLPLRVGQMFAFEYFAYSPIEEWGGKKLRVPIEDDAILMEDGVQFLHPANHRLLVIK